MNTYRPVPGTLVKDLDTPCLLIDLDALENNFKQVAITYADSEVKMRQHTKNTKSPLLASMQIKIGGTVGGVCTAPGPIRLPSSSTQPHSGSFSVSYQHEASLILASVSYSVLFSSNHGCIPYSK